MTNATGEFLFYQSDDNQSRIEVRLHDETVWLSQSSMAELFQTTKQNISLHLKNIFKEGELNEGSVVKDYLTTASDGKRYQVISYNLEAIISVGYRVKSNRGTQFRIWATQRLREYIVKGFAMDDERLKLAGGGNYFDELLARIRDIRSSEKVFWRKILDIYATSIDYDPRTEITQEFFATVQNKLHYAAHGHTAAEIIYGRADSGQLNMGLTNWPGTQFLTKDIGIAKNYLNAEELEILNRMVSAYLEIAELQASMRRPMYMKDWRANLDDVLRTTGRNILDNPGKVSHEAALEKARGEHAKYLQQHQSDPTLVEQHFIEAVETNLKQIKTTNKD